MPKLITHKIFLERCGETHGIGKYKYPEKYNGANTPLKIICTKHGGFTKTPKKHIFNKSGCPECALENRLTTHGHTYAMVIGMCNLIHGTGTYEYPEKYNGMNVKHEILCHTHGGFKQSFAHHIHRAHGCPSCAGNKPLTDETFANQVNAYHGTQYEIIDKYTNNSTKMRFGCNVHGIFTKRPVDLVHKQQGCPKCSAALQTSIAEREIGDFIISLGVDIIRNQHYRGINRKIDIICPTENFAFEQNGNFMHSDCWDINFDKNQHLFLTELCLSNGVELMHGWEDQWRDKRPIVESMLRSRLNRSLNRIRGNGCVVKLLDKPTANEFYDKSHIQGGCNASVHLGLFDGLILVACMSFKKVGFMGSKGMDKELIRFCNKLNTNVVGAAGVLLSYYVEKYKPKNIVSYADRCISNGNLYEKLGFRKDAVGKPDYKYVIRDNRFDKVNFTKAKIKKKFPDVMDGTEREMMRSMGYWRIWDCGKIRYVLGCE